MRSKLKQILLAYEIEASIGLARAGPTVTAYPINLPRGTRISKLNAVLQDIARDLNVQSIRLVKDKGQLYLEIPNTKRDIVLFSDTLSQKEYMFSGKYDLILGVDIFGVTTVANLRKLPHLLVAGSTGSGKSVGLHMLICSLLAKNKPSDLQLLLIDPKKTELSMYEKLPHLLSDVITESNDATIALEWCVNEMENRYRKMEQANSRDMLQDMPVILIIIDEMADLILSSDADIKNNLIKLAQKARACGIHIIAATQRPSREIVTGLIKANFPARLAYKTASSIDSRVILDAKGAELLLGQGDSLYMHTGALKRLQGAYISDEYMLKYVDNLNMRFKRVEEKRIFKHEVYTNPINTVDKRTLAREKIRLAEEKSRLKDTERKRKKNLKINLALWGVFFYSLYRMIKSFIKLFDFKGYKAKMR